MADGLARILLFLVIIMFIEIITLGFVLGALGG